VSEFAPPKVTPVDTVGAGDTFAGAFAVSGDISFANAAGALATLKAGAQPSIPTRREIEAFASR
jgi:ribokinase